MRQHSEIFKRYFTYDANTSTQLNEFLEEHPNYKVSNIAFNSDKTCYESLFVVFNIEEDIKD